MTQPPSMDSADSATNLSTRNRLLLEVKDRLRINTVGLRLFLVIMGSTLVGIGGMAFLFGETVKYQAEEQIQTTLDSKVSTINEVIDQAESLAYGLSVSVSTLHVRGAETQGTYQELTRQLFAGRPGFVTGLGFGQKEYGVLPNQDWFFPFYQSAATAQPANNSRYRNRAEDTQPYEETDSYQQYFLTQQNRWTTPYESDQGGLLTYYSQIFDDRNEWLGTTVVNIDGNYLSEVLNEPIFRQGGELILLTESGDVIAHPTDPKELGSQTYKDIPDLEKVWDQMSVEKPGFIEGDSGYWSYTHIPDQEWRVLAYVPYSTVFGPVVKITFGATTLVALLLATLIGLAMRNLNQRLQPMIEECQRLANVDGPLSEKLQNKDEIDQLSLSFFNLLEQLQLSQSQVRAEAAHAISAEEKLKQVRAKAIATQMRQQIATQELESQTSAQAMEAIKHFSHLLDSLNQVSDQVHTLELAVTNTKGDVHTQTGLIEQLQKVVATTHQLSGTLTEGIATATQTGNSAADAMDTSQQAAVTLVEQLTQFEPKTQTLAEAIQQLHEATDRVQVHTRKHQRIASSVQVVLLNASTLSISASQQRSPEEFEDMIGQFQDKATQLKELGEQLQASRDQQQQQVERLQEIATNLGNELGSFGQSIASLNATAKSSHKVLKEGNTAVKRLSQQQAEIAQSGQQLTGLGASLQTTLQEMSAITKTAQTRLDLSYGHTLTMERISDEMTESTAGLLKQAEEKYAAEVGKLSA